MAVAAMALGLSGAAAPGRSTAQEPSTLCGSLDRPPMELARQLAARGEVARTALLALAGSTVRAEILCGIAGLSALGDTRAVPHIVRALRSVPMRDDAALIARWAAVLGGGAEPGLGAAMRPVLAVLEEPAVWRAAGDEGTRLLGEIDAPEARDRLLAMLTEPLGDAALDTAIHAIARQQDPRAVARITVLGDEAVRAMSGNATPEQARRLGEVAFFHLAVGAGNLRQGLDTLETIAPRDRAWAASWAVHTLCAAVVRRPAERAAIEGHRAALVAELDERGIDWRAPRGVIPCADPAR